MWVRKEILCLVMMVYRLLNQRYLKLLSDISSLQSEKIQAKGSHHSHASYFINEFNVSVLALSQRIGHSGGWC